MSLVLVLFACKKECSDTPLTDNAGTPLPRQIVIVSIDTLTQEVRIGNNDCMTQSIKGHTLNNGVSSFDLPGDKLEHRQIKGYKNKRCRCYKTWRSY